MHSKQTSEPIARISPNTKVHQMRYVKLPMRGGNGEIELSEVLALATEDGRILFYSTSELTPSEDKEIQEITPIAQLGGLSVGMVMRIKDFKILHTKEGIEGYFIATACSDGTLRVWLADPRSSSTGSSLAQTNGDANGKAADDVKEIPHYGTVLGIYETGRRITSMDGMVVTVREGHEEEEHKEESEDEEEDEDSDDSE